MKLRLVSLLGVALAATGYSGCLGNVEEPGIGAGGGAADAGTPSNADGMSPSGSGGKGNTGSGNAVGTGSGGSGSGGSGSSASGGMFGAKPINLDGSPMYYRFVRLTNAQWAQSVQDILKLAMPSGLDDMFQDAVAGTTDFTNNEIVLDITQRSWSDFQDAAETLAAQVTATDAALQKVVTGTDAATFIQTFGRRVYRRPLTAAEVTSYMALHTTGSTMTGSQTAFTKGAALVIRAMLQSPYFLYRSELGATGAPLTGYEMAAKLSLLFRGTTPSDALLDSAAGPGKLDTADGAATLAQTMVGETAVTDVMRRFHSELLQFASYATVSKTGVSSYKDTLNDEFLQSSYLFFDKVFAKDLGVKDILTSTSGFVGPGLAKLYGVTAPASGFVERDLGATRVGYFSQIPYLALYGINLQPDAIHRGVKINLNVLCVDPGVPNVNVPSVPAPSTGLTNRETITNLTSCATECHGAYINPIGFAFEHFDGMGQWRDTETVTDAAGKASQKAVDSSGTYPFAEGTTSFAGAADLMQTMSTSSQAHACYAKKLSSFALQRDIVATDMPLLDSLKATSMGSNGSLKQVVISLVKNNAFRTRVGGAP